ncbi:MAG: endonuclease domain-containing protein [Ruminococcaceae bacterium]|nr:endonuclease domain-containing protein [Oscillospiraceae bacterium]
MNNNHLPRNNQLTGFAKTMRKNPTDEEKKIWYGLLRYITPKFHRQRIIGNYIADFYCPKLKLVVEIDGGQHNSEENLMYDKTRTEYMSEFGYEVLRLSNNDITYDFKNVSVYILDYCKNKSKQLGFDFQFNPERKPKTKKSE